MKTPKAATLLLILILLGTNAAPLFSQKTPGSIPQPPESSPETQAEVAETEKRLIEALERAQGEVRESRSLIKVLKQREAALEYQLAIEKKNGNLAGEAYQKAVEELAAVRGALASAKSELNERERREKGLKEQIKALRSELHLTRFGAAGIIALLLYLLAKK